LSDFSAKIIFSKFNMEHLILPCYQRGEAEPT